MTASYNPYVFLVVLMCLGAVCAILPILFARFFAPQRPSKLKGTTYECGVESKGDAWVQFRVQYYLYAILFVIFDIETVFIYPWAVAFNKLGLFAFVEMLIFLVILVCGLAYAWAKGVLEW